MNRKINPNVKIEVISSSRGMNPNKIKAKPIVVIPKDIMFVFPTHRIVLATKGEHTMTATE